MKKIKRSLIMIVMLTAIVCLMSAFTFSASAAAVEKIEVETWSQLRDALMNYNDNKPVEIKLTRDISREFDDYEDFDYGLFAVAGNKTLDLNGRIISAEVTIGEDNAQYLGGNHFPYLFSFYYDGSSLTIKDTSAACTGKVHYDASLVAAKKYITSPICDIFNVNSGSSLTIEGGTYEVGHERKDWTTAVYINGKLFTGNLRTQVYGTVFSVGAEASLTVNGGTFIARGGHFIDDKTYNSAYTSYVFDKKSLIYSSIEINGGEFIGKGGAAIFSSSTNNFGINIRNGEFRTSGIDNVLFRYGGLDGGNLKKGDMQITSSMLADGIEKKVIVNGNKNYTYAPGSAPQTFFRNNNDTLICTVYDFIRQTPEIPDDRVTSVLEDYQIGANKVIAYEEKPLPEYMTDAGFSTMFSFIVRDSSNTIIATKGGTGLKEYNLASIKNPGQYTITTTFDLLYDNLVVDKAEHTFIFNANKTCNHNYVNMGNTATCTTAGVLTEVCSLCGDTKTTDVEALDHLSLSSDYTYNSTHHWYYCRRCYTPTLTQAHSWKSSTERICTVCRYNDNCEWGNAMDTEYDENYHWWPCDTHESDEPCPNNHQLERELHTISQPYEGQIVYSCQDGYVCDGCGEYFGETGDHKWVLDLGRGGLKVPTCTEDGYRTYKCEYNGKYDCKGNLITCTAKKRVTLPKLEHSIDYNNPTSDTATCFADGVRVYSCTRNGCGAVVTRTSPKRSHSYTEWNTITSPTCQSEGKSTATCTYDNCNHTETMILDKLEHSYGFPVTDPAPTCTANGKNIYTCTNDGCGETKTEIIEKLGHSYTDDNDMSCDRCGSARGLGIPATVTATQTADSVTLTWASVEGATGYRVFVSDSGWKQVVKATTATSCTLKNLTPGTKYTYAVRAYLIKDGTVTWAPKYAIFTTATQPALIKKVTSTKQTATSITISWDKVNCGGYRVFQYNPTTKRWDIAVKSTRNTTATITGLTEGKNYIFAVRPYVNTGTQIIWAKTYTKVTTSTMLSKITLKALSSAKGRATIAWGKASGATGYQVWYSTSPTSGYKKIANYTNNSTYQYGLTSGTTYYYRARAYKAIGGSYVYGAWSDVVSVKIK